MKVAISFNYEDSSYYMELEDGKRVTLGSGMFDNFQIPAFKQEQFTFEMHQGNVYFSGKPPYAVDRYNIPLRGVLPLSKKTRMFLHVTEHVGRVNQFAKLPFNGVVTIGRSTKNMIVTGLDFMSREHMQLTCKEGIVTVKNLSTSNGIFVNGQMVKEKVLKSGDIISVFTFRIIYLNNELYFENIHNHLTINKIPGVEEVHHKNEVTIGRLFHRPPRRQNQLPEDEIILATPPNKANQNPQKFNAFMPLLSMGTMFATSMLMGAASPAYMAARSLSLIMPLANMAASKKRTKQMEEQLKQYESLRRELYGKYIDEQKERISGYADQQREIIQSENPSPQECLEMVAQLKPNLWERTARDRDFLDVRLGMGYEKLCVSVKAARTDNSIQMGDYDNLKKIAEEIIDETAYVDNIPTRIPLRKYNTIGIVGNRQKVINSVRNLLISLSATHFYKDVKIVGVFNEDEAEFWKPLRWLPHVFDDQMQSRFLALNYQDAQKLCQRMNDQVIEERKRRLGENQHRQKAMMLPHYIFVLGSQRYVNDNIIMENLLLNQPELGITSIFLFDNMYDLPLETQYIVNLDVDNGIVNVNADKDLAEAYEPNKYNHRYMFKLDSSITTSAFDSYARSMSAIKVAGYAQKADIPNMVTFLQGYKVEKVEDLKIKQRWSRPRDSENMPAPLGIMSGGRVFELDTYESKHGPHGLIAGATGEGKSELVKSWVLSMMVNYHPHDVNFVFIDYKGGGMASNFKGAPHVVGEITNLATGMDRAFAALTAENNRRMQLFQEYGVADNDIKKYHILYKQGRAKDIVPHLFIVVDEFRMMKQQSPEAVARMNEIATIGRALGVHLVLATQSPGEVIDGTIQKNSQYSLALRLQFASESRELIGTSDATTLRNKGRCYVNVKRTGTYEVFQSFFSGAPYYPNGKPTNQSSNQVYELMMDGTRVRSLQDIGPKEKTDLSESDAIVKHIIQVSEEMGIQKVPDLWLPELPEETILLDLCKHRYNGKGWEGKENWLQIPIGIYDSPTTQSQGVQYIDFNNDGNLGIYGVSQSGKTNLLKTIMMSIGLNYSPEDVQIYGIDCGNGSTAIFQNMPHVGGIARNGENEKIDKLIKMVTDEIQRRRKHFLRSAEGIVSLKEYREVIAKDIPAWIFFIDNFQAFYRTYQNYADIIGQIASDGLTNGIYFIFTSVAQTNFKLNILESIQNSIAFELNDRGEYTSITGKPNGVPLPYQAGRALLKGNPPIVMQTCLFMHGDNEMERSQNLRKFIEEMNNNYDGPRAKRIPVLPEIIRMSDIMNEYKDQYKLPIGMSYQKMETVFVDFKKSNAFVVSGTPQSGKSRFLENISGLIKRRYPEVQLYIFDGLRRSLSECEEYATGYAVCSDQEKSENIYKEIATELTKRMRSSESSENQSMICIVVDDIKEFIDTMAKQNEKMAQRIFTGSKALNTILICAGNVRDINELSKKNPIVMALTANRQGLIFSGTLADHTIYSTTSLSFEEKRRQLQEGEAYLVDANGFTKVKPAG